MDLQLEHLCTRYGVPLAFAERLRPLLLRAQSAAPDIRRRILELVETSLENEAQRLALEQSVVPLRRDKNLATIAQLLHDWSPPKWILDWDERDA